MAKPQQTKVSNSLLSPAEIALIKKLLSYQPTRWMVKE